MSIYPIQVKREIHEMPYKEKMICTGMCGISSEVAKGSHIQPQIHHMTFICYHWESNTKFGETIQMLYALISYPLNSCDIMMI